MYLAKHVGGWSTTRIGRFYNGRDHSTVCYAVKKIEMLRNAQPDIDELLVGLQGEIVSEVEWNRTEGHHTANHPAGQAGDMLVTDQFLDLVTDLVDRDGGLGRETEFRGRVVEGSRLRGRGGSARSRR